MSNLLIQVTMRGSSACISSFLLLTITSKRRVHCSKRLFGEEQDTAFRVSSCMHACGLPSSTAGNQD